MQKKDLRIEITARLRALTTEQKQRESSKLQSKLIALDDFFIADAIFLFCPLATEPETGQIFERARELGKIVAYPKCNQDGKMDFYAVADLSKELEKGAYGIMEPNTKLTQKVSPKDFEKPIIVVPGRAFDGLGNRLGRGAGFYDKYLAENNFYKTIGYCYKEQIIDKLPIDEFDQAVDIVLCQLPCNEETTKRPIGIFDSGIGGLTTMAVIAKKLPGENFIYYGDNANAPYGTKTTEEVLARAKVVAETLAKQNAKAIVIACNTATGAALEILKKQFNLPVIGTEPALKTAANLSKKGGKIVVFATPLTLKQQNFAEMMEKYGENALPIPCEGLMDFVENEDFVGAKNYIGELFSKINKSEIESVVLGCTHYVFLKNIVKEMLPKGVNILDGNEETANQLLAALSTVQGDSKAKAGNIIFQTSGNADKIIPFMQKMYKIAEENV